MHRQRPGPARIRLHAALLVLRVHLGAARRAPGAYLAAAWWRMRGKRVRAQARFAALLALSPSAYEFWTLSRQKYAAPAPALPSSVSLVCLVGVTQQQLDSGRGGLDRTMESLKQAGIPAVLIGDADAAMPAPIAALIDRAATTWFMPVMPGDEVAPNARQAYGAAADRSPASLVYADDDLLDPRGFRTNPHFKPRWNGELFRHFDYLTGACIVRAEPSDLERLSGSDWARMLVAGAIARGEPVHLAQVLHHRSSRPKPCIAAAPQALVDPPLVSVIIPMRNRHDLLQACLAGLTRTSYPRLEVLIVDNDSDDPESLACLARLDPHRYRVMRHRGPFNYSRINNEAVRAANGQLLCLLNNDIEMLRGDWLTFMAAQAVRPDVGAVGAQLLYPDGRIQHAGVVVGMGRAAGHAHRFVDPSSDGYFRRHALPQFVSAVTGACLVVRRDRFLAAGGLDEINFPVAFNDVDLCLRLNQRGWQSFYEPRATLIHHESISRGFDRDPQGAARFAGELRALQVRWGTADLVDPFHHPQLSRSSEQFVMDLNPTKSPLPA